MATLTLKPGPRLLYHPSEDEAVSVPAESAHLYLFDRLRLINGSCLGDFVLLVAGNPHLQAIYARSRPAELVREALRWRENPDARRWVPRNIRVFRILDGGLDSYESSDAQSDRWDELYDRDITYYLATPIVLEPLAANCTGAGGIADQLSRMEPKLGEVLELLFGNYAAQVWATEFIDNELMFLENPYGPPNDYGVHGRGIDYDEDRRLADYDAETDLIRAELDDYAEQYSHD